MVDADREGDRVLTLNPFPFYTSELPLAKNALLNPPDRKNR